MGELAPENGSLEPEATEEAPAWTGPSQEEWQATQEALQGIGPLVQQWQEWQNAPDDAGDEDEYEFDPLDPQQLKAQIEALVDSRIAPVSQYTQQQQFEEAEERAMDILGDIATREGEFLYEKSPELARSLANQYVQASIQKFGPGPQAAEDALHRAYKDVRAWEDAVGQSYHERQINQLGALGQARREPGAAGTAASGQLATPEGGDEVALARAFTGGRLSP